MNTESTVTAPNYRNKSSLWHNARNYAISDTTLHIFDDDKTVIEVPLAHIQRLNLAFTPKKRVYDLFTLTIETTESSPISVPNITKERRQERNQSQAFNDFLKELAQRVAIANPHATFEHGCSSAEYVWHGLIYGSLLVGFGFAAIITIPSIIPPIIIGFVLYRYIWPVFQRNRRVNKKGTFDPNNIPELILPMPKQ